MVSGRSAFARGTTLGEEPSLRRGQGCQRPKRVVAGAGVGAGRHRSVMSASSTARTRETMVAAKPPWVVRGLAIGVGAIGLAHVDT